MSNLTIVSQKWPVVGLVDWIISIELKNCEKICVVIDEEVGLSYVEEMATEWLRVKPQLESFNSKVEVVSFGKEVGRKKFDSEKDFIKCYEDVSSVIKLKRILGEKKNVKLLLFVSESVLDLGISLSADIYKVSVGQKINFETLINTLFEMGYERVSYVESLGQFSIRGEIVDIWPNSWTELRKPLRIQFEDDVVHKIKEFDVSVQKSISNTVNLFEIEIFPTKINYSNGEKKQVNEIVEKVLDTNSESVIREVANYFSTTKYYGNEKVFTEDVKKYFSENYQIVIGYNYEYEKSKLEDILKDFGKIIYVQTSIERGFWNKEKRIFFITYNEIFSHYDYSYKPKKSFESVRLEGLWEIQPNDFVVHREYGIGKFLGIERIQYGEKTGEFLSLLYANNAKLYVSITEFSKVEKYVSLTHKTPQLSYLDKVSWQRKKIKIKESLRKFVAQLYEVYSFRKKIPTAKFGPDTELETQLEESFGYEETKDQINAISDVKQDLCSGYPMDRVIVGDVGFGKTEVAIRAAFKSVINGKQVLILCPTTVLAEQHYRTFVDRLSAFAVNVGIITRLQKKDYLQKVVNGLSSGEIDIVIGTHMLLSDKIKFADLGLVIIDEEHKFGVKDKEKIRLKYKLESKFFVPQDSDSNFSQYEEVSNISVPHILSLTATPIPRTLSAALEGIKDISVIETPPVGRQTIETFIIPYDENTVFYAINRELNRNGQVYYVFNNVALIEHKTNLIQRKFPYTKIGFIHSKLTAKNIEDVMLKFINNEIKILVTTTIIESGLDMPNVNTIIVENADRYGLAQLYQLRGRVGRRNIKAYAYFTYEPHNLTLNAKKRLSALTEFASLGSGYKLALRDLEIRGAGELLGTKQHGVVNEIGLNMYSEIIQEMISEIGVEYGIKPFKKEFETEINLTVDAYIPSDYIFDDETRIVFYRKILDCKKFEQLDDVYSEMEDRFGKIKKNSPLYSLFLLARLKIALKSFCVEKLWEENEDIYLKFTEEKHLQNFLGIVGKNFSIDVIKKDTSILVIPNIKNFNDIIKKICPQCELNAQPSD